MKTLCYYFLFILLFSKSALSQNYVPNADFEHIEKQSCYECDEQKDFEYIFFPWKAPIKTQPPQAFTFDHSKVIKGISFAESPIPKSGDMMVGLQPYNYLTVKLEKTLIAGRQYYAECWVALKPDEEIGCNNLGMLFTTNPAQQNREPATGKAPIHTIPQIVENKVVITDGESWHKIAGVFTAKKSYNYLTIGNFFDDVDTEFSNRNGTSSSTVEVGIYFLDAIQVIPATKETLKSIGEAFTFRLENVTFKTGSTELVEGDHHELEDLINQLTTIPSSKVEIAGYTDNTGSEESNIVLSTERAKSIKQYLVNKGINTNRIKAQGFGSAKPVASNDTEEGRAQNRRVEVTIIQ